LLPAFVTTFYATRALISPSLYAPLVTRLQKKRSLI